MDDQNVANWVGGVAIGLMLAAFAWLLVSPSPGTSGGNDQVSDRQVSGTLFAHHRPLDQMRRCIDAAGGVSGCPASSFAPSAPPTPSDRRVQQSTRPGAVGVTSLPAQVPALSAPASPPPATLQSSTPPPAAPARQPLPHHGPVPGGNTSPPHTGPHP
jgi:hypothetical protein